MCARVTIFHWKRTFTVINHFYPHKDSFIFPRKIISIHFTVLQPNVGSCCVNVVLLHRKVIWSCMKTLKKCVPQVLLFPLSFVVWMCIFLFLIKAFQGFLWLCDTYWACYLLGSESLTHNGQLCWCRLIGATSFTMFVDKILILVPVSQFETFLTLVLPSDRRIRLGWLQGFLVMWYLLSLFYIRFRKFESCSL